MPTASSSPPVFTDANNDPRTSLSMTKSDVLSSPSPVATSSFREPASGMQMMMIPTASPPRPPSKLSAALALIRCGSGVSSGLPISAASESSPGPPLTSHFHVGMPGTEIPGGEGVTDSVGLKVAVKVSLPPPRSARRSGGAVSGPPRRTDRKSSPSPVFAMILRTPVKSIVRPSQVT
jgi:hypothetical protein